MKLREQIKNYERNVGIWDSEHPERGPTRTPSWDRRFWRWVEHLLNEGFTQQQVINRVRARTMPM